MSIKSLCSIHEVTIQVATTSAGAAGGARRTWANQRTKVKCRVNLRSPSEAMPLNQPAQHSGPRVYFYFDPELETAKNRIVFTDKAGVVHTLDVKAVNNPHEMDRFWKVDCVENRDATA